MTEAVSEPVPRTDAAQAPAGSLPRAVPGVPWVAGILVGATVSYLLLRALAGYWPLHRVANSSTRATLLLLLSLALAFAFWTLFSGVLGHDMVTWSFPIIATLWWWIAATSWAILVALTGLAIVVSSALGAWDTSAKVGPWAVGGPTPQWGIFFALWCGLNYGVLACIQCWPFSRIRQPWGSTLAVLGVIAWAALLGWAAAAIFDAAFADHATALLEAQVWGWHTVFWGFCFALLYGVGSTPYRWAGQRTPGTWEDVER